MYAEILIRTNTTIEGLRQGYDTVVLMLCEMDDVGPYSKRNKVSLTLLTSVDKGGHETVFKLLLQTSKVRFNVKG